MVRLAASRAVTPIIEPMRPSRPPDPPARPASSAAAILVVALGRARVDRHERRRAAVVLTAGRLGPRGPGLRHERQGRHAAASSWSSRPAGSGSSRTASCCRPRSSTSRTMVGYGGERGLLGLAFHPSSRRTARSTSTGPLERRRGGQRQYQVASTNPDVAVRTSARRIMTIAPAVHEPQRRDARLRPDGYLYIGIGDGGGGGDPGNRAQNRQLAARQDPADQRQRHDRHAPVPDPGDNPYVGRTGRDEIWSSACATRGASRSIASPATCGSATSARTRYEEIDRAIGQRPATGAASTSAGGAMEGRHCYSPSTGCSTSGQDAAGRRVQPRRRAAR